MSDADGSRDPSDTPAPAWNAVVLVCRECRKRRNGPRATKPKAMAEALKRSLRTEQPRPRVLLTNCLGLCPQRATAVARVGGAHERSRLVAIASTTDAAQAMAR